MIILCHFFNAISRSHFLLFLFNLSLIFWFVFFSPHFFFLIFLFLFLYLTLEPSSQFSAVCVAALSNYMLCMSFIKLQPLEAGKMGWDTKLVAQVLQS